MSTAPRLARVMSGRSQSMSGILLHSVELAAVVFETCGYSVADATPGFGRAEQLREQSSAQR